MPSAASDVEVVELNSIEAFEADDWQQLWEHCADATVFQTRSWMQALTESFKRPGEDLKLLAAFDGTRLVGLAPLVRTLPSDRDAGADCWQILGDDYSDYQTFLAWGDSPQILTELLAAADRTLPPGATLALRDLPQFSALALLLQQSAGRSGSGVQGLGWVPCPTLRIRDNPVGAARAVAKRSVIRHERSLAQQGEITVEHLTRAGDVIALLPELFAQHIARWSGTAHPSLFLNPANCRFYGRVVERLDESGVLFTVVRVAGKAAAIHFGLRSRNSLLWYKPAFDIALRSSSPGEVMLQHLIELARARQWDEVDFTRGDEPFKSRFASTVTFNRHFVWHRSRRRRLGSQLRRTARAAVRFVRPEVDYVPRPLGAAALKAPRDAKGARVLLLDPNKEDGSAGYVAEVLAQFGEQVQTAPDMSRETGADYAWIIPCSDASFHALAMLPEDSATRAKALLPPSTALALCTQEPEARVRNPERPVGELVTAFCICVHGKLSWCFVEDPLAAHPARELLERAGWHGFARVSLLRTDSGTWNVHRLDARLDEALRAARRPRADRSLSSSGVSHLIGGLLRIAQALPVGPQPSEP